MESNDTNTPTTNENIRIPTDPTATPYTTPYRVPIHTPTRASFNTPIANTPSKYPSVSNIHHITPQQAPQTASHQYSNAKPYYSKQQWTTAASNNNNPINTNGTTRTPKDPTASIYTPYQALTPNEYPVKYTPSYPYTRQHPSVSHIHHITPQQQQQTTGLHNIHGTQNTGTYTPQTNFTQQQPVGTSYPSGPTPRITPHYMATTPIAPIQQQSPGLHTPHNGLHTT
jgi:hypothetical protein